MRILLLLLILGLTLGWEVDDFAVVKEDLTKNLVDFLEKLIAKDVFVKNYHKPYYFKELVSIFPPGVWDQELFETFHKSQPSAALTNTSIIPNFTEFPNWASSLYSTGLKSTGLSQAEAVPLAIDVAFADGYLTRLTFEDRKEKLWARLETDVRRKFHEGFSQRLGDISPHCHKVMKKKDFSDYLFHLMEYDVLNFAIPCLSSLRSKYMKRMFTSLVKDITREMTITQILDLALFEHARFISQHKTQCPSPLTIERISVEKFVSALDGLSEFLKCNRVENGGDRAVEQLFFIAKSAAYQTSGLGVKKEILWSEMISFRNTEWQKSEAAKDAEMERNSQNKVHIVIASLVFIFLSASEI